MYTFFSSFSPVSRILAALTTTTKSPASRFGEKPGLVFPRSTDATRDARRPRTLPSASATYQPRAARARGRTCGEPPLDASDEARGLFELRDVADVREELEGPVGAQLREPARRRGCDQAIPVALDEQRRGRDPLHHLVEPGPPREEGDQRAGGLHERPACPRHALEPLARQGDVRLDDLGRDARGIGAAERERRAHLPGGT